MTRNRVDALQNRVKRLLVVTSHLDEEQTAVHERIRALEDSIEDPGFSGNQFQTAAESVDSVSIETNQSEASDEVVAKAIQSVDDSVDEKSTDDSTEEIIVV